MKKSIVTISIVFLATLIGAILYMSNSGLAKLTATYLDSLKDRHPEGETYVETVKKSQSELEDADKGNDFSAVLTTAIYMNLLQEKEISLMWYKEALRQDPRSYLALHNLANLYSDLERYEDSEKTWLEVIALYPYKTQSWRSLGYLYRYKMNKSSAEIETLFVRGLKETNNDNDLVSWLLAYFLETDQKEKFVEYANKLKSSS